MLNTHTDRKQLLALRSWMAKGHYTHALTLNSDRQLSATRLKGILSTFCHRFDRAVLKERRARDYPQDLRLRLIAFPENLSTNAHLHCFADLHVAQHYISDDANLEKLLKDLWKSSNRGAGSIALTPDPDYGWAKYITKNYTGTLFLSSDFFPQ